MPARKARRARAKEKVSPCMLPSFLIMDGLLRVSDTSWDYNEKETSYSAMNSIDMPLPELEALPAKIGGLIERSHNLLEALKTHYASNTPMA